jgi:hypothetical protein
MADRGAANWSVGAMRTSSLLSADLPIRHERALDPDLDAEGCCWALQSFHRGRDTADRAGGRPFVPVLKHDER